MKFYSVQLKQEVEVPDNQVEVVTMKNGRKAAKATTKLNGQDVKLFRILGKAELSQLKK